MNPDLLLAPPFAFLIYLALAGMLALGARALAARAKQAPFKATTYASGETAPTSAAIPGYRQYFVIALFFVVLHLGVLVIATGGLTWLVGIFVVGLMLALVALMLG